MKDSDLRGRVLQEFYTRRKEGHIGIRASGVPHLEVPGIEDDDVLRIAEQLMQYGLIEWTCDDDNKGKPMFGVGKISAAGIDVIEGEQQAPIPIHIDQSHNVQHVHIEGQHGAVQVAGAHSSQQQSVEQNIEKLINAVNGASVSEAAKQEAKGILATLLKSTAISAVLGPTAEALLKNCGA